MRTGFSLLHVIFGGVALMQQNRFSSRVHFTFAEEKHTFHRHYYATGGTQAQRGIA